MSGRFILDTNILIALIDGEPAIRHRIAAADEVIIPSPVLGELYFGAFRSKHPEKNAEQIDSVAKSYVILPVDENTARIFGVLRNNLRRIGKPIPIK